MEQALALIRQLSSERFFGALTIKFESSKVVILKKEETIKPNPNPVETLGANCYGNNSHW